MNIRMRIDLIAAYMCIAGIIMPLALLCNTPRAYALGFLLALFAALLWTPWYKGYTRMENEIL
jgi:hypothetical protein